MSHIKTKDQAEVQGKTRDQEPHHGPAGQHIKNGQQRTNHGKGGYPIPLIGDPSQVGGARQMKVRSHTRRDPAHQKLQAGRRGSMQATESPKAAHAQCKSGGTQTNHLHGERDRSRSKRHEVSLCKRKAKEKACQTTSVRKAGSR